jgi:hypothetical protein
MNCDINLQRLTSMQSIIAADMAAREKTSNGKLLDAARAKEEALYTMGRLVQDTSTGMTLEAAIKAFLLA